MDDEEYFMDDPQTPRCVTLSKDKVNAILQECFGISKSIQDMTSLEAFEFWASPAGLKYTY
jgi:hypothetical protein